MAKASAVQMENKAAVQSIDERLERIEKALGIGALAEFSGEAVEGKPMWAFGEDEMYELLGNVEQLCQKAGVDWEPLDLSSENADPFAYIKGRLAMVADHVVSNPPVPNTVAQNTGISPDKPAVEAGRVGSEPNPEAVITDLTPPPDTSGLPSPKNKNK